MSKKKFVISLLESKTNRGSEALARGSAAVLKKKFEHCEVVLSAFGMRDSKVRIKDIDRYVNRICKVSKIYPLGVLAYVLKKVFKKPELFNKLYYREIIKECRDADLLIIFGGDNYDKNYKAFKTMHDLNYTVKKHSKVKVLMFNCSLCEEEIDAGVKEDFNICEAITAREILTFEGFKRQFKNSKVFYYPDAAFAMDAEPVDLPGGWIENQMIGLNVSSLITESKFGAGQEKVFKAYFELVDRIINKTNFNMVLIPHVMKKQDLSALEVIYEKYKDSGRVMLIDDESLNAPQLKYIISKCRMYVGARTHSTIAAYSTCVPTLVLGYSIKSIGIATDIFGTADGYVVSVQDLENDYVLANEFEKLMKREEEIRSHLKKFMPSYINKVYEAGDMIEKIILE